jgi:hypothetical protein
VLRWGCSRSIVIRRHGTARHMHTRTSQHKSPAGRPPMVVHTNTPTKSSPHYNGIHAGTSPAPNQPQSLSGQPHQQCVCVCVSAITQWSQRLSRRLSRPPPDTPTHEPRPPGTRPKQPPRMTKHMQGLQSLIVMCCEVGSQARPVLQAVANHAGPTQKGTGCSLPTQQLCRQGPGQHLTAPPSAP